MLEDIEPFRTDFVALTEMWLTSDISDLEFFFRVLTKHSDGNAYDRKLPTQLLFLDDCVLVKNRNCIQGVPV